jgi:hypothetical protein
MPAPGVPATRAFPVSVKGVAVQAGQVLLADSAIPDEDAVPEMAELAEQQGARYLFLEIQPKAKARPGPEPPLGHPVPAELGGPPVRHGGALLHAGNSWRRQIPELRPVAEFGCHVGREIFIERLPLAVPDRKVGGETPPPLRRAVQFRRNLLDPASRLEQQLDLRESPDGVPVFGTAPAT